MRVIGMGYWDFAVLGGFDIGKFIELANQVHEVERVYERGNGDVSYRIKGEPVGLTIRSVNLAEESVSDE